MTVYTKDEILNLIVDLASPMGPEVFAGYRTKILDLRFKWQSEKPDLLEGILNEQEKLDKFLEQWVEEADSEKTLDILLEIACHPPNEDFINNFYERRKEEWNYSLVDLIYRIVQRNKKNSSDTLKKYRENSQASPIVEMVESWLSDSF